jgi:hypothetical protein
MSKYHCLKVQSESCDDYGPFLFEKMPSDEELFEFLKEHCEGDMETASLDSDQEGSEDERDDADERGPGWKGSYLHLDWTLVTPSQIPKRKTCVGYRVKDVTSGYVWRSPFGGLSNSAQTCAPLTRQAALRLLADWLDAGYLGTIVRVMR